MDSITKKQVWSCGGGRQSCAIAVLIITGKLKAPDISVISDTGRERFTTFPYLTKYVVPGLASVGVKLHVIKASEWGYYGMNFVTNDGSLMLPSYTREDGVDGKNSPDCSGNWKRDPINRWPSQVHGVTRSQYVKWIGFSRSPKEMVRAVRMSVSKKEGGDRVRFPLIEQGLNTFDCLKLVTDFGWPEPKVSACWMCPNLKDSERRELTEEEKRMAEQFDAEMREMFPNTYLHKSFQPLASVDLTKPDDLFDRPCESGNCFV